MRKWIALGVSVVVFNLFLSVSSHALLNKDIRYIQGTVIKIDQDSKELTIKDQTGTVIIFDVSQARYPEIKKGQEVFVVVPVDSNAVRSVRVINK